MNHTFICPERKKESLFHGDRVTFLHFLVGSVVLQVSLQAGLRTLHEAGPELRRAISGSLEEATEGELEPATRRNLPFFGSVIQSIRRKGSMKSLTVNNVQVNFQSEKTNSYPWNVNCAPLCEKH